jgi:hypothetical protein
MCCCADLRDWGTQVGALGTLMSPWLAGQCRGWDCILHCTGPILYCTVLFVLQYEEDEDEDEYFDNTDDALYDLPIGGELSGDAPTTFPAGSLPGCTCRRLRSRMCLCTAKLQSSLCRSFVWASRLQNKVSQPARFTVQKR